MADRKRLVESVRCVVDDELCLLWLLKEPFGGRRWCWGGKTNKRLTEFTFARLSLTLLTELGSPLKLCAANILETGHSREHQHSLLFDVALVPHISSVAASSQTRFF